ncbi:MAG: hypothetical protein COS95_08460 [Ignavibacteriales bacterium CG07_land_8_20_14_0_80_59_12]|nr:MAG: hypothetical protein COS95_08460 [Ignavibacteriales bacterium CG07_land_8_20_14_0_80_59_12]
MAFSGGGTRRRMYEILTLEPLRSRIPWTMTHIFWGDERCVPPDDPGGNALMVHRALLDHVRLPSGRIRAMNCAPSPAEGARSYLHRDMQEFHSCRTRGKCRRRWWRTQRLRADS